MTTPEHVEAVARAICAERCAFYGEPPCWSVEPDKFAEKDCDEPGCRAMAQAAVSAPLSPAVLAALPEVQAMIRAETERCADLVEAILKQDAKAAEPHNTEIASDRWEYAEQLPAAIREGRA